MHWALGAPWIITNIGDFTGNPDPERHGKTKTAMELPLSGSFLDPGLSDRSCCPLLSGSGLSPPCNLSCPELGWYVQPA